MYCKKCGKELSNDSIFCNYCGTLQKTMNSEKKENNNPTAKKDDSIIILVMSIIIIVVVLAIVVSTLNQDNNKNKNNNNNNTSSLVNDNSRPAKIDDLIIKFRKESKLFEEADYYMDLQSNEEIIELKMNVNYLSSADRILKTEVLNIGKVVPGNKYEFYLSLNGMNPSDLDKIDKFSYRILSGTVIE